LLCISKEVVKTMLSRINHLVWDQIQIKILSNINSLICLNNIHLTVRQIRFYLKLVHHLNSQLSLTRIRRIRINKISKIMIRISNKKFKERIIMIIKIRMVQVIKLQAGATLITLAPNKRIWSNLNKINKTKGNNMWRKIIWQF